MQGLGEDVSTDQVADYFKQIGIIKVCEMRNHGPEGRELVELLYWKCTGIIQGRVLSDSPAVVDNILSGFPADSSFVSWQH